MSTLTYSILMKYKLLLCITFFLTSFFSCEKDLNTYPKGTFKGTWNVEENGSLSGIRRYQAVISQSGINDRVYLVNNFYKTGMETELYFSYAATDSSFTVDGQVIGSYFINGTGKFHSDQLLEWHFYVNQSGGNINEVEAVFRR